MPEISNKIESLNGGVFKFSFVTKAYPMESCRNNSPITFFREVGHYLYVTEYKFGNTNARSSRAAISITIMLYSGDSSDRTGSL